MERLQWWLLLLSAVMFSMSGCASVREWCREGAPGRAPCSMLYAFPHHMAFSMKSHKTEASITQADREAAAREGWWGRVVPPQPATPASASAPTPMDKQSPEDIAAGGSETVVGSEPAEGQASARVTARASAKRDTPQPD